MALYQKKLAKRQSYGLEKIWGQVADQNTLSSTRLFLHHLKHALRSIVLSPLTTTLTLLTFGVVVAILGVCLLFFEYSGRYLSNAQREISFSVYLKDEANQNEIQSLEQELRKNSEVSELTYISKEAALNRFREELGEENLLLEGLADNNPLPASFELRFSDVGKLDFSAFSKQFRSHPAVAETHFNRNLAAQVDMFSRGVRGVAATLLLVMLALCAFIMWSTLALALYSQREEIEIMALVGASKQFIAAPYLIEGGLKALFGVLIGFGMLWGGLRVVRGLAYDSSILQLLAPSLHFLSAPSLALLMFGGVSIGFFGSLLAVNRFQG